MVSTEIAGRVDKELERKVYRSEPLLAKAYILGRACEVRVKEQMIGNNGGKCLFRTDWKASVSQLHAPNRHLVQVSAGAMSETPKNGTGGTGLVME